MADKFTDLSEPLLTQIKAIRFDFFIDKHEGPQRWGEWIKWYTPEFIAANGKQVLIPVQHTNNSNIEILRQSISVDGELLILFLKDTTSANQTDDEFACTGFIAICQRIPNSSVYVAIFHHQTYLI